MYPYYLPRHPLADLASDLVTKLSYTYRAPLGLARSLVHPTRSLIPDNPQPYPASIPCVCMCVCT